MFVTCDLIIPVTAREAQARFVNLMHGTWLAGASQTAYDGAHTGLLRVGPAGGIAAKRVRVTVLEPVYREDAMTAGLRWEATGPAGALFPMLDANITISPAAASKPSATQHARVTLTGVYRPPLGRAGAALDQVALQQVASATIQVFLRGVTARLTSPDAAPASGVLRPQPGTT